MMSIFTASREQGGRVALWVALWAECDISVSRLPGLETFANFLVVSVSASENLVSKKKSRYYSIKEQKFTTLL